MSAARAGAVWERAAARSRRPVSGASLAAFRIAFGLLGLAATVRFAAKGWIADLYLEPESHFSYPGFWWVEPLPGWEMYAHFALMGAASVGVALGFKYRLSIIAFFLLFTYAELIDKTTYLNHYYLISLLSLLMIFLPMSRAPSADALLAARRRKGAAGRESRRGADDFVPAWTAWALRAQLSAVYLFGGVAKLNADWLWSAQPMRIWLGGSSDAALVGHLLAQTWAAYAISWAGAAFDLTIAGAMLWSRTRPAAYIALVAFHVATWLLFPRIGMFPWIMICAATVFFPPDWPLALRRRAARLFGADGARQDDSPQPPPSPPREGEGKGARMARRLGLAAAVAFAIVQIAAPMRHLAYPGDVLWNEEGYRFSWRVMLTEKAGYTRFRVRLPQTGEEWFAYPEDYLTPLQAERMAHRPDMILAAAHLIAAEYARRGMEVEVRADAFASLNGRRAARLVDPDADLARMKPGILPKRWILAEGGD